MTASSRTRLAAVLVLVAAAAASVPVGIAAVLASRTVLTVAPVTGLAVGLGLLPPLAAAVLLQVTSEPPRRLALRPLLVLLLLLTGSALGTLGSVVQVVAALTVRPRRYEEYGPGDLGPVALGLGLGQAVMLLAVAAVALAVVVRPTPSRLVGSPVGPLAGALVAAAAALLVGIAQPLSGLVLAAVPVPETWGAVLPSVGPSLIGGVGHAVVLLGLVLLIALAQGAPRIVAWTGTVAWSLGGLALLVVQLAVPSLVGAGHLPAAGVGLLLGALQLGLLGVPLLTGLIAAVLLLAQRSRPGPAGLATAPGGDDQLAA